MTSTDGFDSDLNENRFFTTSDALQTTGAKCNHGSASIWQMFDSICRQLRCSYSSLQANSVRAWPGPQQLVSTLSWYLRHARRACLRYERWSQLSLSAPPMCTHDGPASEAETERALCSSNVLYLTWPRWALASVTADACPMRCFATRQRVHATPPCGFAVVFDLRLRYPASVGTLLCAVESRRANVERPARTEASPSRAGFLCYPGSTSRHSLRSDPGTVHGGAGAGRAQCTGEKIRR